MNDQNFNPVPENDDITARLTDIQTRYTDMLMSKQNVIGVAIGMSQQDEAMVQHPVLVVMVTEKVPDEDLLPEQRIPTELEGIPVEIRELGRFSAM